MTPLEGFLRYIELLGLTLWDGGIAFFSFIASPSIFHVLGLEGGGSASSASTAARSSSTPGSWSSGSWPSSCSPVKFLPLKECP